MIIGGGSRGKDCGQWNGWGLEEPSRPAVSFFDEIIISYIYIKYSTRNKYNPFEIQIFIS